MGEATAEFKESDVTRLRRPRDLARVARHSFEIVLVIAMEMPVGRVERDFEVRDDASHLVNLGEHHQAVGTGTFDAAHMMIGCAQPPPGLLDDCKPT